MLELWEIIVILIYVQTQKTTGGENVFGILQKQIKGMWYRINYNVKFTQIPKGHIKPQTKTMDGNFIERSCYI